MAAKESNPAPPPATAENRLQKGHNTCHCMDHLRGHHSAAQALVVRYKLEAQKASEVFTVYTQIALQDSELNTKVRIRVTVLCLTKNCNLTLVQSGNDYYMQQFQKCCHVDAAWRGVEEAAVHAKQQTNCNWQEAQATIVGLIGHNSKHLGSSWRS